MSINATLLGQMITFTLLVWFTMKYVWPPLIEILEARKKKIAEGLAAAEKAQEDTKLTEKKIIQTLKKAKNEAADITILAQKRANETIEQSKNYAKLEADKIIVAANASIEQEIRQAKEILRKEVSALALQAAEQILQKEIDKTKHTHIINKISSQLGQ